MISSQLSTILDEYARRGGELEYPSETPGVAVLVCGDDVITVGSEPDADVVMLFCEAACAANVRLADHEEWVVLDDGEEDEDGDPDFPARPFVTVYDASTGRFALTGSASATDLDPASFDGWVHRIAAEAAQLRAIVESVDAERRELPAKALLPRFDWLDRA